MSCTGIVASLPADKPTQAAELAHLLAQIDTAAVSATHAEVMPARSDVAEREAVAIYKEMQPIVSAHAGRSIEGYAEVRCAQITTIGFVQLRRLDGTPAYKILATQGRLAEFRKQLTSCPGYKASAQAPTRPDGVRHGGSASRDAAISSMLTSRDYTAAADYARHLGRDFEDFALTAAARASCRKLSVQPGPTDCSDLIDAAPDAPASYATPLPQKNHTPRVTAPPAKKTAVVAQAVVAPEKQPKNTRVSAIYFLHKRKKLGYNINIATRNAKGSRNGLPTEDAGRIPTACRLWLRAWVRVGQIRGDSSGGATTTSMLSRKRRLCPNADRVQAHKTGSGRIRRIRCAGLRLKEAVP